MPVLAEDTDTPVTPLGYAENNQRREPEGLAKLMKLEEFRRISERMDITRSKFIRALSDHPEALRVFIEALKQIETYSDQVVQAVEEASLTKPLLDILNQPVTILEPIFESRPKRDRTTIFKLFKNCGIEYIGDIFLKKAEILKARGFGQSAHALLNQCLDTLVPGLHLNSNIDPSTLKIFSCGLETRARVEIIVNKKTRKPSKNI